MYRVDVWSTGVACLGFYTEPYEEMFVVSIRCFKYCSRVLGISEKCSVYYRRVSGMRKVFSVLFGLYSEEAAAAALVLTQALSFDVTSLCLVQR